jgi:hypothetical protein
MKKLLIISVIGFAMTAGVAAICIRPGNASKITFDSYQKIQEGMSRQQVEEILGGPPRNESGRLTNCGHSWKGDLPEPWWGPKIVILIWFDDEQQTVRRKKLATHGYGPAKNPSFWDLIRSCRPW